MKCSLPIAEISQLQQTIYENNSKLYQSICQSLSLPLLYKQAINNCHEEADSHYK